MHLILDSSVSDLSKYIHSISGVDVNKCYQCGKCAAGCPVSQFLEESPTKIIRLIQLGQKKLVRKSKTPYLCASCTTCSVRCPMEVDIAKIMECIRIASKRDNIKPALKKVVQFSETFLDTLKTNGRLFELGFMIKFKIASKTFFQDVELSPRMLKNHKLGFIPRKIKNVNRIKQLFDKSKYFIEEHSSGKKH